MKSQITNHKSQINFKPQCSKSKTFGVYSFGVWILFCAWCLVLGAFSAPTALAETTFSLPSLGVTDLKGPQDLVKLIFQYAMLFVGIAGLMAFMYGGVRYL